MSILIKHQTYYRLVGQAARFEVSCKVYFYNHCWYKNNVKIEFEEGYSLEYHCIRRNTYGTYVCRYQDTNGTLYLEEFQLMPYPEGLHPTHITPYCQSRLHSPQIEPHISVRKLSLYPITNPSRDTQTPINQHPDTIEPHISVRKLSLYPITNPSRDTQTPIKQHPDTIEPHISVRKLSLYPIPNPSRDTQTPIKQHPDTIEPHISVQQERMCVPIPASCVRESSAPILLHSREIEPHPSTQKYYSSMFL